MINQVTLVGRLTKDPELRTTQDGILVTHVTLAVNRHFKNQNGIIEADFVQCTLWRKTAENTARFCQKGSVIGITGRLHSRHYDNNEGKRVYVTEVVAESVQFLGKKVSANAPVAVPQPPPLRQAANLNGSASGANSAAGDGSVLGANGVARASSAAETNSTAGTNVAAEANCNGLVEASKAVETGSVAAASSQEAASAQQQSAANSREATSAQRKSAAISVASTSQPYASGSAPSASENGAVEAEASSTPQQESTNYSDISQPELETADLPF